MRLPALFLAAVLLAALPLAAQPATANAPTTILHPGGAVLPQAFPPAPAAAGGGFGSAIVVALCGLGGAWLWWRLRRNTAGAVRGERKLAVSETRPLGNRQYLVVADYEGRKFLLGVCPGRIDLLAPLGPGEAGALPPRP